MLVYVAVFIANVYCNINSLKVCVKCIKCLELWQKCLWLGESVVLYSTVQYSTVQYSAGWCQPARPAAQ